MATKPSHPAGSLMTSSPPPPTSDRDLQPHQRSMLDEARKAARSLAQRQADAELVARAAFADFKGEEWGEIVGELASYGWGVVFGWLRTGKMEARCHTANRPCPVVDVATREPEWAESPATDVVIEAIERFRDEVLIPGVWDPTRGTTLKSFFVGQILKRFANVYRRWYHAELEPIRRNAQLDEAEPSQAQTEKTALDRISIEDMLDNITPHARRIVELRAQGRTSEEIAAELDTTIAAVDSCIYRLRRHLVA